jgi:hypothetical protein
VSRRGHIVVDAFTGEELSGAPSYQLIAESAVLPTAVPARQLDGVWVVCPTPYAQRRVRAEVRS